jgi:hypothetical protein
MAYLSGHVGMDNTVLEMAHKHKVAGLEPAVKNSMVVDMAKHRAGAGSVCCNSIELLRKLLHQRGDIGLFCRVHRNKIRLQSISNAMVMKCSYAIGRVGSACDRAVAIDDGCGTVADGTREVGALKL